MSQDPSPTYQVAETDGVSVLTVLDRALLLDGKEIFYEVADSLVAGAEGARVVLNLEKIQQFQSAMLAVLINFQKRVRDAGGSVKVCSLDPEVNRVFLLTKMDQIFDIRKTEQDAVAAFRRKGPSWLSKIFGN